MLIGLHGDTCTRIVIGAWVRQVTRGFWEEAQLHSSSPPSNPCELYISKKRHLLLTLSKETIQGHHLEQ
jgi:hypothetical protein